MMEATLRGLRNEMAPPTENVVEINSNHMISTYVYQYIYLYHILISYIYIHIICISYSHIYHKMISFRSAKGDWKQEETDTKRKRK